MLKYFSSTLFQRDNESRFIHYKKNIYILCERSSEDMWQLSYLMLGSNGNYLIGLPKMHRSLKNSS